MRTKVSNKSFDGQSFYIGLDVHKKSWKTTILSQDREHKTMSLDPVPEVLAGYLKRNFPGGDYYAVYEAGFSGFEACRRLKQLDVDCKVIHPADVSTNQKQRLQKTDKADSRKLAKELRKNEFEPIHIPDSKLEADRALVRHRFRLSKEVARTKNRVKSLLFQFGIDIPERFTQSQTRYWSRVYLDWLKNLELNQPCLRETLDSHLRTGEWLRQELLLVNRKIRSLSLTDAYRGDYLLLISIPGIGLHTAMFFLVQIGDMRRFKCLDYLCNYVGLVPSMHSSGDKQWTGKMVKRGRKDLKIMLIEASWKAIGADPALMAKYNELKKRMNGNKAIIRIARKMLSRMRYVLLHQQKYELGIVE